MAVVAVGNLKGGVGKSTLAVNIASALGRKRRTILLDLDDQGTSTEWATAGLLPVEVRHVPSEEAEVRELVQAVAAATLDADLVVLDLPPRSSAVLSAVLALADLVVVPVTPSGADLAATSKVIALLQRARLVNGTPKPRCLLVPSRVDRRTAAGKEIDGVLHELGEPVGPAVGQRSAHADAFGAGVWVGQFAPRSPAHEEIEVLAAVVGRQAK